MAIAECISTVDPSGRELVVHGTAAFPIACYHDDLCRSEVPWHWHEELEAAIITEGRAIIASGREKYVLNPGEGIFINSGVLHGAWHADTPVCRIHSLVFHPRLVGGSLDSVFYQDYVRPLTENATLEDVFLAPGVVWQQEALSAMETAWQACFREDAGYEFRVRSALSELVWLLHSNLPGKRGVSDAHSGRSAERIKAMLSYIHLNYAGELSTRQIAASAMISESECLRCFRSTIGTTPIQYVKQYRIQQAAQLLSTTQERVSDIASRCGFQDMSYFTRSFREIKGCVPTEYRKSEQHT